MSISVLTPLGALLALAAVLPLVVLGRAEARARGVAARLGLPAAPARTRAAGAAVVGLAALLGLAASQPVLALDSGKRVRTDAEVYVVLDTSRSMLAGPSAGPARFERAKGVALRLRPGLDDVPVGLASFTDRVLPHLFPSSDPDVYAATLERVLQVEHPPPERRWEGRATTFAALSALAAKNFYAPEATTRVLVLLTDGETRPYSLAAVSESLRRPHAIVPVAVHVWREGEQLVVDGRPDRGYESDPRSAAALADLASATGGVAVAEDDLGGVVRSVRQALGEGDRSSRARERRTIPLAPWLVLAGLVPLAFLVARRNLA